MADDGNGAANNDAILSPLWLEFSRKINSKRDPFGSKERAASVCARFIAITESKSIDIFDVRFPESKPLFELQGHHSEPTYVVFGNVHNPTILISGAADYIIMWNIEDCLKSQLQGGKLRGHMIAQTPPSTISHMSCDVTDSLLSVCVQNDLHIFDLKSSKQIAVLQGHSDTVRCSVFPPHFTSTLVSAGADRVFMVWNVETAQLLYASAIVSAYPFIAISSSSVRQEFVLGTSDGILRFYDLRDDSRFQLLHQLDLGRSLRSHAEASASDPVIVESGLATLAMKHITLPLELESAALDVPMTDNPIRELLGQLELLLVATPAHLFLINARSLATVAIHNLSEAIPSLEQSSSSSVGCIQSAFFATSTTHDQLSERVAVVDCLLTGLLDTAIHMVRVHPFAASSNQTDTSRSVFASIPVLKNSPLRSELVAKQPKLDKKKGPPKPQRGVIIDKPLTFKSKVKSSGYAVTTKRQMFAPQVGRSGDSPKDRLKPNRSSNHPRKCYPPDGQPVCQELCTVEVDSRPTAIKALAFSGDGQHLACACTNKTVLTYKMPLSSSNTLLAGHAAPVNSVAWSQSCLFLISSSNDCSARLWCRGQEESVLHICCPEGNIPDKTGPSSSSSASTFNKEVTNAQFFYLDRFLLLSTENNLFMYKYHLSKVKDDVKRYLNPNRYKLASRVLLEQAKAITTFSAINSFYSYIVLAAGSDRSIQVLDMNTAAIISSKQDAHTRPAHCVSQNEGSVFTNLPAPAYDLFLTAAVCDGIKLWDLRTSSCVRRYELHVNRVHPCKAVFSPCGKYISTASEDCSTYVYDIGSGNVVSKLAGFRDVTTVVACHPLYNQMAVGTNSGHVTLFGP